MKHIIDIHTSQETAVSISFQSSNDVYENWIETICTVFRLYNALIVHWNFQWKQY